MVLHTCVCVSPSAIMPSYLHHCSLHARARTHTHTPHFSSASWSLQSALLYLEVAECHPVEEESGNSGMEWTVAALLAMHLRAGWSQGECMGGFFFFLRGEGGRLVSACGCFLFWGGGKGIGESVCGVCGWERG
jgi:hypothetical protein